MKPGITPMGIIPPGTFWNMAGGGGGNMPGGRAGGCELEGALLDARGVATGAANAAALAASKRST